MTLQLLLDMESTSELELVAGEAAVVYDENHAHDFCLDTFVKGDLGNNACLSLQVWFVFVITLVCSFFIVLAHFFLRH